MTSSVCQSTKRSLLIISAGIEAIPAIQRAKEMGFRAVVSDANANAPGVKWADDFIHASTYDVADTVAAAARYHREQYPLSGVMTIAADVPLTVASVARELNLPGISIASAKLATDKLAMKERFAADGVPIPWFSPVADVQHLQQLLREKTFPLIIKPVDSRGARGVLRLLPHVDPVWAFQLAQGFSPTGRVMVEQYLSGPQVSTESIVLDGVAHTVGFSDRNYELLDRYAPHVIENGGDLPSALPPAQCAAIRDVVDHAARSLGITRGVVKGDIVVHQGEVFVIELAARLSGGYFCSHEIPLNTGVDFVGSAIKLALGQPVDAAELQPRFNRAVSQRYIFPEPGQVVDVDGAEQVTQWPDIALCEVRVQAGSMIGPMDCHPARAGVIIAVGDDVTTTQARARAAVQNIRIRTTKNYGD